jgi:hypothetical protein
MAEVTMTLEEYMALVRSDSLPPRVKVAKPAKRRGAPNPRLAKALRDANAKARKKNGEFRKGYDQARVMRMAHASLKKGKR